MGWEGDLISEESLMEKEDCQLRLLRDWMEEGLAHFSLRGMFLGRCMGEMEAGKISHEIPVN